MSSNELFCPINSTKIFSQLIRNMEIALQCMIIFYILYILSHSFSTFVELQSKFCCTA